MNDFENKNIDILDNDSIQKYMNYFKEDLDAIEEELNKSKEYSKIIDDEIEKLTGVQSLGANKGNQRYLIEHITNAVSLQTQRQSLRKDRVSVKKMIVDFASRDRGDENAQSTNLSEAIERLIKKSRDDINNNQFSSQNIEDVDADIDVILGREKE